MVSEQHFIYLRVETLFIEYFISSQNSRSSRRSQAQVTRQRFSSLEWAPRWRSRFLSCFRHISIPLLQGYSRNLNGDESSQGDSFCCALQNVGLGTSPQPIPNFLFYLNRSSNGLRVCCCQNWCKSHGFHSQLQSTDLGWRWCYYSHFMERKTKSQSGEVVCPRLWLRTTSDLCPETLLLTTARPFQDSEQYPSLHHPSSHTWTQTHMQTRLLAIKDLKAKETLKYLGLTRMHRSSKSKVNSATGKWIKKAIVANNGFPGGSDIEESAYNARDLQLIPRSGRSPGEGNDNPLQYSCLENPMDRGAWWTTVHGMVKSQTWLTLLLQLLTIIIVGNSHNRHDSRDESEQRNVKFIK